VNNSGPDQRAELSVFAQMRLQGEEPSKLLTWWCAVRSLRKSSVAIAWLVLGRNEPQHLDLASAQAVETNWQGWLHQSDGLVEIRSGAQMRESGASSSSWAASSSPKTDTPVR
jgi:hypothetical protein